MKGWRGGGLIGGVGDEWLMVRVVVNSRAFGCLDGQMFLQLVKRPCRSGGGSLLGITLILTRRLGCAILISTAFRVTIFDIR